MPLTGCNLVSKTNSSLNNINENLASPAKPTHLSSDVGLSLTRSQRSRCNLVWFVSVLLH